MLELQTRIVIRSAISREAYELSPANSIVFNNIFQMKPVAIIIFPEIKLSDLNWGDHQKFSKTPIKGQICVHSSFDAT